VICVHPGKVWRRPKPRKSRGTATRGAVDPLPAGKTRITIYLDDNVLTWFRSQVEVPGGGNYHTLINAGLREHVGQRREPLEETLR
jgi:uncharacterized protein (DUF4415 family)